jgi:hypothetical protein
MDPGVLTRMEPPGKWGGAILFPRRDVFVSKEGISRTPEGGVYLKEV